MRLLLSHKKIISLILIIHFTFLTICSSPALAGMVTTAQVLKISQQELERKSVIAFLEREDVQKQLEAWGLDKAMAKARINNLTDEEISRMAQQLDRLPAGGSALGTVVGTAFLIFIILLVTDILGFTDVFPFTK